MIGIYEDKFKDYLEYNIGKVKINSKNIICPCPWCEFNQKKNYYHLWISIEFPIWHCFKPNCPSGNGGVLRKLIKKISGRDNSQIFVNPERIKEKKFKLKTFSDSKKKYIFPEINEFKFKLKTSYMIRRLGFHYKEIVGLNNLVFDIKHFIEINKIQLTPKIRNILDFLNDNFIGFVTTHQSYMILRNINDTNTFSHFKLFLKKSDLFDYYKLEGNDPNCNTIVLSEGIFDIFSEQISNTIREDNINIYAAGLSVSYASLIKSIGFDRCIFKADVHILSDRDVHINFYRKLKRQRKYCINNLIIHYNKFGKDFNDTTITPERFII